MDLEKASRVAAICGALTLVLTLTFLYTLWSGEMGKSGKIYFTIVYGIPIIPAACIAIRIWLKADGLLGITEMTEAETEHDADSILTLGVALLVISCMTQLHFVFTGKFS